MIDDDRPVVLLTARHPSAVSIVRAMTKQMVPGFTVHLVATGAAARALARTQLDPSVNVWLPSADQERFEVASPNSRSVPTIWSSVGLEDQATAIRLRDACAQLVTAVGPRLIVRTTTAEGLGPDEIVPTVADDVPTVCVQDFYGVGFALTDGEHPVAQRGVDVLCVPDQWAMEQAQYRGVQRVQAVGWTILDDIANWGVAHPQTRETRSIHRIGLVGGANGLDLELDLVSEAVGALGDFSVEYRPHPRLSAEGQTSVRLACEQGGIEYSDSGGVLQWAVGTDTLISAGSNLNLQVMAFGAADPSPRRRLDPDGGTVSCFRLNPPSRNLVSDPNMTTWLDVIPPTHEVGRGSVIAPAGSLAEAARQFTETDARRKLREQASTYFSPSGAAAKVLGVARELLASG